MKVNTMEEAYEMLRKVTKETLGVITSGLDVGEAYQFYITDSPQENVSTVLTYSRESGEIQTYNTVTDIPFYHDPGNRYLYLNPEYYDLMSMMRERPEKKVNHEETTTTTESDITIHRRAPMEKNYS